MIFKRLAVFAAFVAGVLCVPLIAMQFSSEVKWTTLDFVVAGCLLLTTALAIDWVLHKVVTPKRRFFFIFVIAAIAYLVWVELAVGIW